MPSLKIVFGLLLLLGVAQAYIRLAPLPRSRLDAKPGPMTLGVHPATGGVTIVQPLATLPPDGFARLLDIIAASPRTGRIGTNDDPAAFVTRSRFWGMPDITVVWVAGENLHLNSHLVFGRADFEVNAARAAGWFERLGKVER